MGRISVFNNWSPYILKDFKDTVWIGIEYFCDDNDKDYIWNLSDEEFCNFAIDEAEKINLLNKKHVKDSCCYKVAKAYPAYFGVYECFD